MDKVLNFLGLSLRAKKVICGEEKVLEGIKKRKVFLVFVGSDTSTTTKKRLANKAFYYNVPVIDNYENEELIEATSLTYKIYGIIDLGIAKAILERRQNEN